MVWVHLYEPLNRKLDYKISLLKLWQNRLLKFVHLSQVHKATSCIVQVVIPHEVGQHQAIQMSQKSRSSHEESSGFSGNGHSYEYRNPVLN